MATSGTVPATLTKLEKEYGVTSGIRVHSPRSWFATLAKQLLYTREDREKLGHWAPGSLMPERYDRATCATELRLRGEILQRVRNGWEPDGPFETPRTGVAADPDTSSVSSTSAVTTDPGNLSEVDISDLGVLGVDGSKGYV